MSKKTSILGILLMNFLILSLIAGLASQNTPYLYRDNNNQGNPFLTTAAWAGNGNAICTQSGNQLETQICSDGAGGAIIVWEDTRSGNVDIYAQKINSTGSIQWISNGVALCIASSGQYEPQICSDGAGGAIVTWKDTRNSVAYPDIYAIRITSAGVVQWAANGLAICTATNEQTHPQICSDGSGGAVITWMDLRDGLSWNIYAQKVSFGGIIAWSASGGNGIPVANGSSNQRYPQICSDGLGGAIITWREGMSVDDIYAGRILLNGAVQWTSSGVAICTATDLQGEQQICSDGSSGAIITWQDNRGGTYNDIYAQHVTMAGSITWKSNGIAICNATSDQQYPQICSDSANGAIITWQDWRGSTWDVYARRIISGGTLQWGANGTAICTATNDQINPQICSDGANGAIIAWQDKRGGTWNDIYTQRLNSTGIAQWTTNGAAICTGLNHQYNPELCSDGAKGAIITWEDFRSSAYDVYAQRAYLALPATPTLNTINPNPSTNGIIFLNWTQCANATRYYVFRSTSQINSIAGLTPLVFMDTSIHTYTDNSFVNVTFYYVIVAGGILLNSSISNCENVTVEFTEGGLEIPAFELGFLILGLSLLVLVGIRKKSTLNLQ